MNNAENAAPLATDITADDKKFVQLLSNMKAEVKKLSHNELARQFTSLYAQFILLQSQYDLLKENYAKPNNSGESNV